MKMSQAYAAFFLGTVCISLATPVAAQSRDTASVVSAVLAKFESEADGKTAAILSAFVSPTGPVRSQASAGFVHVPFPAILRLAVIQPPSDSTAASRKAWTAKAKGFARLYSIGTINIDESSATVDTYTQERLANTEGAVGLTNFRYFLQKSILGWKVVKIQPLLSTTFVQN
jgi:hypothetical protein